MSIYCRDIVRQHDPDRFLLSLLAPLNRREALWALFAFNYEIAKTREVVSDTTIGLIRLQWWRDAIGEIYQGKPPREHVVITPLAAAIEHYNLPQAYFDNLIYAREFDLEGVVPATLEGLYNYCNYTTSPLFHLAQMIIGGPVNDTDVVDISTYYALVGTVRAVPYMALRRQMMMPQDVLDRHYFSAQKLFDFNGKQNLPDVIKEVLSGKNEFRYAKTRINSTFLRGARKVADLYRAQIEAAGYDIYDKSMGIPPNFMALRVWFKSHF